MINETDIEAMRECSIKFLYCDDHRGEYWWKCETCGTREWFARGIKPKELTKCPNN